MTDQSWDSRGEARRALQVIVSDPQHGMAALSRPRVMTSLLKDLLPDAPREAGLLIAAAEADLAGALRGSMEQGLDAGTASRLASGRLAQFSAFTSEACEWVTGELAVALGYQPPGAAVPGTPQSTQRPAVNDNQAAQPTEPGRYPQYLQNAQYAANPPYGQDPPTGSYPPIAPIPADILSPRHHQYRQNDPFPGPGQAAEPLVPPPSIRRAVRLMYVGAALALLQAIVGIVPLAGKASLFGQPVLSTSDAGYARGQLVVYALVALISIALWLWMAWASKRGRSWSRIVSAVLFAMATLVLIASLVTSANSAGRLVLFAGWVMGLLAIISQWQRSSSEYYHASSRPVRA